MAQGYFKRYTLFKIPKEDDIDRVLKAYDVLRASAVKDGKPYIIYNEARRVVNTNSPMHEGYTLASLSYFASREDHEFYDKECPAHKELKKLTGAVRTGVCVTVTEADMAPRL